MHWARSHDQAAGLLDGFQVETDKPQLLRGLLGLTPASPRWGEAEVQEPAVSGG